MSTGLRWSELFRCGAERLTAVNRLSDGGWQVLRLERGERSSKDSFRRAERLNSLARRPSA